MKGRGRTLSSTAGEPCRSDIRLPRPVWIPKRLKKAIEASLQGIEEEDSPSLESESDPAREDPEQTTDPIAEGPDQPSNPEEQASPIDALTDGVEIRIDPSNRRRAESVLGDGNSTKSKGELPIQEDSPPTHNFSSKLATPADKLEGLVENQAREREARQASPPSESSSLMDRFDSLPYETALLDDNERSVSGGKEDRREEDEPAGSGAVDGARESEAVDGIDPGGGEEPVQSSSEEDAGRVLKSGEISYKSLEKIDPETARTRALFRERAVQNLFTDLASRKTPLAFASRDEENAYLTAAASRCLDQARIELAPVELRLTKNQANRLLEDILTGVTGYGAIQPLLEDPGVNEVLVNGPDSIYVERKGKLHKTTQRFSSTQHLMQVINKIVSPIGRRVDRTSPTCDARLPDGSRVNIVIPPLVLNGPTMTIRKFSRNALEMDDLVARNSLTQGMAVFLRACIQLKLNIIVSGGTGSGKTTTLNVLSTCIPENERIITLEDAAELSLQQEHVAGLESRPPNVEGKGEVTLRTLLRNSLRMRPDRVVVGECRGPEALDMLQAMNTGHEGSLTTGHANTPKDMVSRLETMVMMAGMPLKSQTIREQISRSLDLIVQQARLHDGTRKITAISEILGMKGDSVELRDIFRFVKKGVTKTGQVEGDFEFCGNIPTFLHRFKEEGVLLPENPFGDDVDFDWLIKQSEIQRAKEAQKELTLVQEQIIRTAGLDTPYDSSPLMMSIKGMRVMSYKSAEFTPLEEPEKPVREELDHPPPGQRQALTDKEILGSLRKWLLRELANRIKRLVAFEKLDVIYKDIDHERAVLRQKLKSCFQDVSSEYRIRASDDAMEQVLKDALRDAAGLGPIQLLIEDEAVDEIMVNGPDQVYVERRGKLHLTDVKFRDDSHVRHVIERILTRVNRRADKSNPITDARLQDGSRVNVVLAPISLAGCLLTIRKFSHSALRFQDLVDRGTLSAEMGKFLQACVQSKISLIVSGGTGSGKTSTLNALSAFIPEGERVITIEDAAELRLQQPHVVPLESRPASQEGTAAVLIRDLVRNSLRMRPDRVVIGECRGPEALDMLQAMNTGHEGSMTSAHANSPRDLVSRIETMVMMGNIPLTSRAIREQIFTAVQLVVQQERMPDGSRRITSVAEYIGFEGETLMAKEIFRIDRGLAKSRNSSRSPFSATGHMPRFLQDLTLSGAALPDDIFGEGTSIKEEVSRRTEAGLRKDQTDQEAARKQAEEARQSPAPASKGKPFSWKNALARSSAKSMVSFMGQRSAQKTLAEDRSRMNERILASLTGLAMASVAIQDAMTHDEIYDIASECLEQLLLDRKELSASPRSRREILSRVTDEVGGLGPIQPLLEDPEVSEVMVNGHAQIYVERGGKLELTDIHFKDDGHAQHVLNRILAPLNRRCDVKQPLVDARLSDGSRVHAAIPPVALNGPTLTIRKFSEIPFDLDRLVEFGALPEGIAEFLRSCVQISLNMVISGGTGSGKTTLLNALSGEIPYGERVVTIEDSAELALQVDHVVGLEARTANLEGTGGVSIRELVRNSLRMRPDRIVVGECRGSEALDMLQAMNTGHEGSMTTAHANNTLELLKRIETMVLMANTGATIQGIREQIAAAIDLVVQQRRFPDGRRRVTQVSQILDFDGEQIQVRDLFLWHSEGVDEAGLSQGRLIATGQRPTFLERMRFEGRIIPDSFFDSDDPAAEPSQKASSEKDPEPEPKKSQKKIPKESKKATLQDRLESEGKEWDG